MPTKKDDDFFRPVPKPAGGKKKGKRTKSKKKTVELVDEKAVSEKEKRRKTNNNNRTRGKATEREIAKRMGGHRVPLSGGVKNSVHNLEGDVQIRDIEDRVTMALVECKNSARITPSGDRVYQMKKSTVEQMIEEAELGGNIGMLRLHWNGMKYEDDIVLMLAPHVEELTRLARLGRTYERKIDSGELAI